MKLTKFLLFLSIAVGNGICAMDLKPKKEKLSKRGQQAAQDIEVQKIIAQKIIEPVMAYIAKEPEDRDFAKVSKHGPSSITFSPDGSKLAVGEFGTILIFDAKNHRLLRKLEERPKGFIQKVRTLFSTPKPNKGWSLALSFNPDGDKLAVWLLDGIEIWDLNKGDIFKKIEFKSKFKPILAELKFTAGGTKIEAMSSEDKKIYTWNINTGKLLAIKNINISKEYALKHVTKLLSPDYSKRALYQYFNNIINIIDVKNNTLIRKIENVNNRLINKPIMAFSPPNGAAIVYVVEKNTGRKIPAPIAGVERLALMGEENYEVLPLEYEEWEHWIQISFTGNKKEALQWLTNKLLGQKTFLLPDQAETIRKMYEAHKNNKPLMVNMKEAIRFSKMPNYVKDMLKFYFGPLIEKKEQKEAPLTNVPQKKA